jgi:hypothetical protein
MEIAIGDRIIEIGSFSDLRMVAMKIIIVFFSICTVLGMPTLASASIVFDIFAVTDNQNLGYIEFASGGVLSDTSDVLDFSYTQKYDGIFFDETTITALNVLVDEDSGQICWGDWTSGMTTIDPTAECGRQTDPFDFPPYGLTGMSGSDFLGFWAGGKTVLPSRATDAGDDDGDLHFVVRAVPEPYALMLFVTGLVYIGIVKHTNRRSTIK